MDLCYDTDLFCAENDPKLTVKAFKEEKLQRSRMIYPPV